LVTGEISGIIVFDFDGPKGAATMRKMGLQPHRQTPNDGFHVDRAWPGHHVPTLNAKSKKALNAKYPGMDIRGDGGYAVVAGSAFIRHPDGKTNGETRPYCWLINAGGELQMPREEWLRVDAIPARVDSDRLVRMALDRLNFSGRNDTGLWLVCQLRDNNYSANEALGVMLDYAARCPGTNAKGNAEPYSDAEIRATVEQAYSRPPREPWGHSSWPSEEQDAAEVEPPPETQQPELEDQPGVTGRFAPRPRYDEKGRLIGPIPTVGDTLLARY
jgi:hypothetical protein